MLPSLLNQQSLCMMSRMNERQEYTLSKSHQNRLVVRFPVKITAIQGQARRAEQQGTAALKHAVKETSATALGSVAASHKLSAPGHFVPLCLQYVALERPLPFAIRPDFNPELLPQKGTVYESGIEGVTFNFRWAFYG